MLARRAVKGGLPLIPAARKLQDEILTPSFGPAGDGPLESERRTRRRHEEGALMVLGTAMQTYGDKLTDQQEVLSLAADIIIDVFAAESALLRAAAAGGRAARRRPRGSSSTTPRRASRSPRARARGDDGRRHAAHAAGGAAPRC